MGVELVTQRGQTTRPLNYDDIYEVIESIIKLAPEELESIQMQGPDPNRVDITTATLEVWNRRNIYRLIETKIQLNSRKL